MTKQANKEGGRQNGIEKTNPYYQGAKESDCVLIILVTIVCNKLQ